MALAATTNPTAAPQAPQAGPPPLGDPSPLDGPSPLGAPDFLASLKGDNSLTGLLEAANGAEESRSFGLLC